MEPVAGALVDAFTRAYAPFVRARMAERGLSAPADLGDALTTGEQWLADALAALLDSDFESQPRSPLELFQEAMRFPTEVLRAAGADGVGRDAVAEAALPGDVFDLAPASSQDLGEQAWRAHIAWGASKAASVTRPVAALLSADIMDGSKIEPVVVAAGYRMVTWRTGEAAATGSGRRPAVVFVDLAHRDADSVIGASSAAGSRVVAFGPHVDDLALTRAMTLGAVDAVARSRFFRSIETWLPRLV